MNIMLSKMYKGGVILIGSLYWENENNCVPKAEDIKKGEARRIWREDNFIDVKGTTVAVPIRYGRKSTSRYCTFTMVFSKELEQINQLGKAKVLEFKAEISSMEELKKQSIDLANVEGIYKKSNEEIFSDWAGVSIIINEERESAKEIRQVWNRIYPSSLIKSTNFKINNEESCLNEIGILNIAFPVQAMHLDYLLSTAIAPNVKNYPNGKEIALAMNQTKEEYYDYFVNNILNGIRTKDDEEIYKNIESEKIKNKLRKYFSKNE